MSRQTDRQTDILMSATGKFLLWLVSKGGKVSKAEARQAFGNNFYTHAYRLAMLGFLIINKELELTPEGLRIANCIKKCIENI